MSNYPATLPHDPPKQIAENLFVVHGCVRPSAIARFTRNMAIVRHNDELTLINPVRMDDPGLAQLEALGSVKHVLRLGPMHGMDDPFYVDRYQATFWSFTDGTTYTTPEINQPLSDGGQLPFPGAQLFAFDHMSQTEGAILLKQDKGILLTCDGIQSYATPPHTPHTNTFTRLMMPFIGFPRKTLIGPVWMKLLVEDKAGMKAEFERLLTLEFDQLLAAHGTFLEQGAHAEVSQAFAKMFD
ncbi:MAG: hypothetical protein AAF993_01450 [Pseudomonadota bacterium]